MNLSYSARVHPVAGAHCCCCRCGNGLLCEGCPGSLGHPLLGAGGLLDCWGPELCPVPPTPPPGGPLPPYTHPTHLHLVLRNAQHLATLDQHITDLRRRSNACGFT